VAALCVRAQTDPGLGEVTLVAARAHPGLQAFSAPAHVLRRSGRLALALVAAGLLCAPLSAQLEPETPTGSRVKRAPTKVANRDARLIQKEVARCIINHVRTKAEAFLAHSDSASVDYVGAGFGAKKATDVLWLSECLGEAATLDMNAVSMRIPTPLLRNLLAEELDLAGNSKPIAIPQGGQESVARLFVTAESQRGAALAVADFADCITFADPAGADALLRTGPATADESGAVRKLMPALSACVVAGQNLALTPGSIRSVVADGMWSRYHYGTKVVAAATTGAKN
jgi:hypothetical protein